MKKRKAVGLGMWVATVALTVATVAIGTVMAAPVPVPTQAVVSDWNGALSTGGGSFFDFAIKQVRQIFQVDRDFEDSLSVSPDGHWILYTRTEEFNTDIMLVENLH